MNFQEMMESELIFLNRVLGHNNYVDVLEFGLTIGQDPVNALRTIISSYFLEREMGQQPTGGTK